MTDTELDIDPAFAAHLQRTLRGVAATVQLARDDDVDNVVRLATDGTGHDRSVMPGPIGRARPGHSG